MNDVDLNEGGIDVSWEEHNEDGEPVWAYTAMAPILKAYEIEHTMLVQSDNNNNRLQYPATHNYQWFSVRRFHPEAHAKKAAQHQLKFAHGRRFLMVDGFQYDEQGDTVPHQTHLTGDESSTNMTSVASLLILSTNLFNKDGSPILTPFTKTHRMPNGHGFYL